MGIRFTLIAETTEVTHLAMVRGLIIRGWGLTSSFLWKTIPWSAMAASQLQERLTRSMGHDTSSATMILLTAVPVGTGQRAVIVAPERWRFTITHFTGRSFPV